MQEIFIYVIEVQVIYSVLLISTLKNDSVTIYIYIYILFFLFLSIIINHRVLNLWYHLHLEYKIWHNWTWNRHRTTDMESRLVVAKEEGKDGLGVPG